MGAKGVNGWCLNKNGQSDVWLSRSVFVEHKRRFVRFFSQGIDGFEDMGLTDEFLFKAVLAGKIQKQDTQ